MSKKPDWGESVWEKNPRKDTGPKILGQKKNHKPRQQMERKENWDLLGHHDSCSPGEKETEEEGKLFCWDLAVCPSLGKRKMNQESQELPDQGVLSMKTAGSSKDDRAIYKKTGAHVKGGSQVRLPDLDLFDK